jgi:high-affinity iron transporter
MFLDALILILQEIIEATLLISVLLVLSTAMHRLWPGTAALGSRWVVAALACGFAGALLYGWAMPVTSSWFDYAGYEVLNALMQTAMIALLVPCLLMLRPPHASAGRIAIAKAGMVVVVALGIVREGSEIILYLNGVLGQGGNLMPVTLGGLMAAGIGCASALLLYYFLGALPARLALRWTLVLLALFSGNMASQAALLLTQADWLPYTPEAWNSSVLLSEQGIAGQVLYALIGYEANPSWAQAGVYLAVALLVAATPLFRRAWTLKEAP